MMISYIQFDLAGYKYTIFLKFCQTFVRLVVVAAAITLTSIIPTTAAIVIVVPQIQSLSTIGLIIVIVTLLVMMPSPSFVLAFRLTTPIASSGGIGVTGGVSVI